MKRILAVILCAILAVSAFTAVKFAVVPGWMQKANYGSNRLLAKKNIDTVFIGSSMFRKGIDPQTIGGGSDDIYLLSYNGNQPWMEEMSLEYLLEHGMKIKRLVVDMYAYSMNSGVTLSDTRFIMDMPMSDVLEAFRILNAKGHAGAKQFFEMFVSSNNEMFATWPVSFPLINTRYKNGSSTSEEPGSTKEKLRSASFPQTYSEGLNDYQCECMDKLIRLCKENGIELVFLETPKYMLLYTEKEYTSLMSDYFDYLRDKDCTVIASRKTVARCFGPTHGFPVRVYPFDCVNADYFLDLIHLSSDGRKAFGEVLSGLLNEE